MDNIQKSILEAKKHQIQLRIRVEEQIELHLLNWLEIYDVVLRNNINYEIVQLANVTEEEIGFWEIALAKAPTDTYNFDIKKLNTNKERNLFGLLYDIFPSIYPLRFMPCNHIPLLVSNRPNEIIADFAQKLGVDFEEKVYLMYLPYTPVLKLKLKDIVASADQLYDFPMEDILIATPNFHKIIFRSMEDEWRFCQSSTKSIN